MSNIKFTWDRIKAATNVRKHRVSFEEAQTVFYDEYAQLIPDPEHSMQEERFIIMGMSNQLRVVVVCHCYREDNSMIRIISARKATKKEQKFYARGIL